MEKSDNINELAAALRSVTFRRAHNEPFILEEETGTKARITYGH